MAREINPAVIRRYDLGADPLPDDTWGAKATLALPGSGVPILRMVGEGPLRLVCETTDAKVGGAVVAEDDATDFTVGVVVFRRVDGGWSATMLEQVACQNGDLLGVELLEADIAPGDAFAIAVTDIAAGPASGAWLRVYPTSAVELHPPIGGES